MIAYNLCIVHPYSNNKKRHFLFRNAFLVWIELILYANDSQKQKKGHIPPSSKLCLQYEMNNYPFISFMVYIHLFYQSRQCPNVMVHDVLTHQL